MSRNNNTSLQKLYLNDENSESPAQKENQKQVNSLRKIKKWISAWFLQKQNRFNDLYSTALYIWRVKGFLSLVKRSCKFVLGERRSYRHIIPEHIKKVEDLEGEYRRWIAENEPSSRMLDVQKQQEQDFAYRPLISILTPVYNTNETMLEEMIESVLAQTYSNWELCLVDGNSIKPYIHSTLFNYSRQDSRIKVKYLNSNQGISGNSNEGLKIVKGEFVALLDHDDLLSADALFEIVSKLNDDPSLDFIYSDKDTVTEDGSKRFNPLFKPEWSPDILFNINYVSHLNVIRTQLLRDVGGFDSKTDGAQDWDLFLRITSQTDRISHIPRILYHWRCHQKSTASGLKSKPYVMKGQLHAIEKYLKQKSLCAKVEFGEYTVPKITWQIRKDLLITIVIDLDKPNTNLSPLIKSCLSQSLYPQMELIVLNRTGNCLTFNEIGLEVKILDFEPETPAGYAYQSAVQSTAGEVILFLNADLKAKRLDSVIHELVSWTQFEEIGIVGGLLLDPDGAVAGTGLILDEETLFPFGYGLQVSEATLMGHLVWYRNFSAIPVECMAIRRKVIDKVNGFDIEQDKGFHIDVCLRLSEIGYRHFYNPYAVLSFQHNDFLENWDSITHEINILRESHKSFFPKNDPYSNLHINFDGKILTLQNNRSFESNYQ